LLPRAKSNSAEVADLGLDDGLRNPSAFAVFDSEPPPAPKLKSKGVIAMDITEQFTSAAHRMSGQNLHGHHVLTAFLELHMGELVKDPFFTLFESVGALEVSC